MTVHEDHAYTAAAFFDPEQRSNANAIRVHFKDGTATRRHAVEYPVGHPRRRKEGGPLLLRKFENNVARVYAEKQRQRVLALCLDRKKLEALPVHRFIDELV